MEVIIRHAPSSVFANPNIKENPVRFTLTYEGQLTTGSRQADKKHKIRKQFHVQLKRLWAVDRLLANWRIPVSEYERPSAVKWILQKVPALGEYRFLPLIIDSLSVESALEFRVLRPTHKKGSAPDIDNQIKILIDALKMPKDMDQLGSFPSPGEGENPFFVLVQDDSLITQISSIQDELLQPVSGKQSIEPSDVRVLIDVHVRPQLPQSNNVIFFSEGASAWDHRWEAEVPENLGTMKTKDLQSIATQCIYRIRALAENFETAQYALYSENYEHTPEAWQEHSDKMHELFGLQDTIWRATLWPKASAIMTEICKRIYGDAPHRRLFVLDEGSLAGPRPLSKAAIELEALVRQLS